MRFLYIGLIGLLFTSCVPPIPDVSNPILVDTGKGDTTSPTVTAPEITPTDETATIVPDAVLVGAGDIGDCNDESDDATATLIDSIPGTVFTTGDNAYPHGSAEDFLNCFDPSWGRHKARMYPSVGNHDYDTEGAAGYFNYFGAAAGDPDKGYYSYDLGAWHIIVLNSEIRVSAGSAQEKWLRADLAANPVDCTLAYWHRPRFSSGDEHGSNVKMQPLWQALYDYGADVVLAGHEHNYERFAPQDPLGNADPVRGVREFVVGTGGYSHYPITTPIANSEVRDTDASGVLKLVLHADSYSWEFIPVEGKTFTDSGTAPCVSLDSSPSSDIFIFAPTDDATVKANSPDANFGLDTDLQVDTNPHNNFLIKFIVSGVNGRNVLSTKLRLYNVDESDMGGNFYFAANNDWAEASITWNTAPAASSDILASLGPVNKDGWYEVDLSSLVKGDGIYTILVDTVSGNGANYASKERNPGVAPQLVVSVETTGSP